MRKAVRAIVFKDNQILVMKRNKFGQEFYTLVGGRIDIGETPEQALHREVKEETSLEITNPRLVIIEEAGDPYGNQYIYLADYLNGEPMLDASSEEAAINLLGHNFYQPMWLPIAELQDVSLLSEQLKQAIFAGLSDNFGGDVKTIHSGSKMSYNS